MLILCDRLCFFKSFNQIPFFNTSYGQALKISLDIGGLGLWAATFASCALVRQSSSPTNVGRRTGPRLLPDALPNRVFNGPEVKLIEDFCSNQGAKEQPLGQQF